MAASSTIERCLGAGRLRYYSNSFTRKKSLHDALREVGDEKHGSFNRVLNAFDLTVFGVGSMIGAGIFVMTGVAAATKAGPAITLSYAIAGTACIFAALCYAELACRVPSSGSAYSYSYITIGEFVAWIIGWDLTLEYMISTSAVARGWSGYLKSLLHSTFKLHLPNVMTHIHVYGTGDEEMYLDPTAAASVLILTFILALGVKESVKITTIMVAIKIAIILFVIGAGANFADSDNWQDFSPYGFKGISNGAAVIFFAYLGFDMVVNVAEETSNPQRNLPIGILCSLVISTTLYVSVAAVVTLMTLYSQIDVEAPLAAAFAQHGWTWAEAVISFGAFCGLTTAQISGLVAQPRLYYSLSRDGLLPKWFTYVHPRFRTPFHATIFSGVCAAIATLLMDINMLSDMASIGTLLAFTIVAVCTIILRYTDPPIDPADKNSNTEVAENTETIAEEEQEKEGVETLNSHEKRQGDTPYNNEDEITTEPAAGEEGIILSDLSVLQKDENTSSQEEVIVHSPVEAQSFSRHQLNWILFKKRYLESLSPALLVVAFVATSFLAFICFRWDAPVGVYISVMFVLTMMIPASLMFFLPSKNIPKTFKCPGMPLIPLISIAFNIYLMVNLSLATWIRLVVWLLIGFIVYFSYGIKHSKLAMIKHNIRS